MERTLITNLRAQNYKSLGSVQIELGQITILTGRNGSGKSNVVDVLKFLRQAVSNSLESAIRDRQGIERVRRHSSGHPYNFAIGVDFQLPARDIDGARERGAATVGSYAVEVASGANSSFYVNREQGMIYNPSRSKRVLMSGFDVKKGTISVLNPKNRLYEMYRKDSEYQNLPTDRLFIGALFAPGVHMLQVAIQAIEIYNIDPAAIRAYQSHDPGNVLSSEGANLASVVKRIRRDEDQSGMQRVTEFLRMVTPEISSIDCVTVGSTDLLCLRMRSKSGNGTFDVYPSNVSDGTLRALAILVALFAGRGRANRFPRVLVIEEPETALHPGAAAVLMDAISSVLDSAQVIITTNSPSLLDHDIATAEAILGVSMVDGETIVHPIDSAAREVLEKHLFSAGELLQKDQLLPSIDQIHAGSIRKSMFAPSFKVRSDA